jgi:hypothetical protein
MSNQESITRVSINHYGQRGHALAVALALVFALALCAPTMATAEEEKLPEAAKILGNYVKVTGGRAAYDKIENRVTTATLDMVSQGIKLEITIQMAKPNKSYMLMESEMIGKVERGTDGEVAWENSMMTGPRVLEGDERDLNLQTSTFDLMAYWKDHFSTVETVGVEQVGERPCYIVDLTSNFGIDQQVCFDRESGLIAKMTMELKTPMGTVSTESFPADYREVDGILIPHENVVKMMGQERKMTIDSVKHNVEMAADVFKLPAEIQALVDKPVATE